MTDPVQELEKEVAEVNDPVLLHVLSGLEKDYEVQSIKKVENTPPLKHNEPRILIKVRLAKRGSEKFFDREYNYKKIERLMK